MLSLTFYIVYLSYFMVDKESLFDKKEGDNYLN